MPTPPVHPTSTAPPSTAEPQLERGLGLKEAVALNMIEIVGIGPFVVSSLVIKAMGGPQALIAWLAGALLAALDGFVWSELGAAMPKAGGTYVFLREAYGPGRWGRLMSFLFVWQTFVQAPLSVASASIGFARYAGYLRPLSTIEAKAISGGLVVLLVILLYRRIQTIGKISVLLWVGVVGTMLWLIWGGIRHFDAKLAFDFPPNAFHFSSLWFAGLGAAMVNTVYSYWGYYNICHLGGEIRDPQKYSAWDFSFDSGHYRSVPGDADQSAGGGAVAGSAEFAVHRQPVCGEAVRHGSGAFCDLDGAVDRAGVGIFPAVGLLASAVFRGAGRQLLSDFCQGASHKTFSACLTADSGVAGVSVQHCVETGDGDCRDSGYAAAGAIHRADCGADVAASAVVGRQISISHVVLSNSRGADHRRVGVAFLADWGGAEVGTAGNRAWCDGVSDLVGGDASLAVRTRGT
jgi:Amino acid permease